MKRIIGLMAGIFFGMTASSSANATSHIADHIANCRVSVLHQDKTDRALSPDAHTLAFIRRVASADTPDGFAGELWLGDCRTGKSHRVLPARFNGGNANSMWVSLGNPIFSPDGRQVYVSAAFGGDDLLIQRVNIRTAKRNFVVSGQLHGIIRKGPLQNDLLISQHTSLKDKNGDIYGGYPYYIFTPNGRKLRQIANSSDWNDRDAESWLKRQH